jgi:dipeptidase E
MKKLFLTSSTITENLVSDFEVLIAKPIKGLKVAFISDAGHAELFERTDRAWIQEEKEELINWYDWKITEVILKESNLESLKMLLEQDVVYVNGGLSGYLAKMMRKSGFDKLLPELLNRGIVYVGSSAGSMVMSNIQEASSWYLGEPEPEAINILGLGYIDFQIYPHVKEETRENIKKFCNKGYTYYLMKDGSAVMINGNYMKILGDIEIFKP